MIRTYSSARIAQEVDIEMPLKANDGARISGEAFLLTVGAFLLTVKLLCLQSLKTLIRRTFLPL